MLPAPASGSVLSIESSTANRSSGISLRAARKQPESAEGGEVSRVDLERERLARWLPAVDSGGRQCQSTLSSALCWLPSEAPDLREGASDVDRNRVQNWLPHADRWNAHDEAETDRVQRHMVTWMPPASMGDSRRLSEQEGDSSLAACKASVFKWQPAEEDDDGDQKSARLRVLEWLPQAADARNGRVAQLIPPPDSLDGIHLILLRVLAWLPPTAADASDSLDGIHLILPLDLPPALEISTQGGGDGGKGGGDVGGTGGGSVRGGRSGDGGQEGGGVGGGGGGGGVGGNENGIAGQRRQGSHQGRDQGQKGEKEDIEEDVFAPRAPCCFVAALSAFCGLLLAKSLGE